MIRRELDRRDRRDKLTFVQTAALTCDAASVSSSVVDLTFLLVTAGPSSLKC